MLSPFNPLVPTPRRPNIIWYSCSSLRYIHHLWFAQREDLMSLPCWYLVNLPQPVASVSQTERPHTWVLVSRDRPGSPRPPTGPGEGGRRDRGGPNKNTTWHPHGKQPTYCQPASGPQYTDPLFLFWLQQSLSNTYRYTHTHTHTDAMGQSQLHVTQQVISPPINPQTKICKICQILFSGHIESMRTWF